ncbi:MAG: helicase, partial [Boseongicola sp. SB0677_bin_26]|nr:helicase [Boseongicola sp. SB0677_bin_26]
VRRKAYADHGIELVHEDPATSADAMPKDENETIADANSQDETAAPAAPVSRLLREGRSLPLTLVDPAPIPGKWQRLDLQLPTFEFGSDDEPATLKDKIDSYNARLTDTVASQIDAYVCGEAASLIWRDAHVSPADTVAEDAWIRAMSLIAGKPIDASRVVPDLSRIGIKVDRQQEFIDQTRMSFRITLDNRSSEPTPKDSQGRCNTIFGAGLLIEMPSAAHRPMRLDRVEPSYRFRDYFNYPAIGLNCGIATSKQDDAVQLVTTAAPRFEQPRIVARHIDVPCQFATLADPAFDVSVLGNLPNAYRAWTDEQERRLSGVATAGLDEADAKRETDRLRNDLDAMRNEARLVERGVELLITSREAATKPAANGRTDRETLERRAAPWRAWTMTNLAFSSRDRHDARSGWRLFQMAFILAHIPVFASRISDWRDYHDPVLDEDTASLLYFPTGGGKSEAFYGTLLFAMFLDRLRGKDRGITALIRYPLRLLTLQQAQRLLKLLMHAEMVRRRNQVGSWPFEIGFWVGNQNTPNRYAAFRSEIPMFGDPDHPDDTDLDGESGNDEARARGKRYVDALESYNKVPECPICRSPTGLRRDERDGPKGKRAAIVCFNSTCEWNTTNGLQTPLPFLLTDDTIYARAPAVVLGTIDKLAMIGQHTGTISKVLGMFGLARWIDQSGNLDTPRQEENLRGGPARDACLPAFPAYRGGQRVFFDPFPSLIVQDEAHLLEESLGTFSGIFDTLLDQVFDEVSKMAGDDLNVARQWTGDGWGAPRKPKIVAATATISGPDKQLETLYKRRPIRFPCRGPDIYHSFFSEPAAPPSGNEDRMALARTLPVHLAPEATTPWMRLYVSLMTNGATHTVTTVKVLAAFHAIITEAWDGLVAETKRSAAVGKLRAAVSEDAAGKWRRDAIDRAVDDDRHNDVVALVDLHRIALAYVTNKKGGDQIIDALGDAIEQQHRPLGRHLMPFDSRLISGGIDMKEIQSIMEDAQSSLVGIELPDIATTLRNIVATSAISHGVDVDRFNSMFFAGLPSDIAEYIQASSRVGRAHVGFVMLLPTPQNRRDRYVVETHDVFHRFLERMIAPPAVERWAENAIKRTLASHVQAWAMLREAREFLALGDDRKSSVTQMDQVGRFAAMARGDHVAFRDELGDFILRAIGFVGRGSTNFGAPHYGDFYRGLVEEQVDEFVRDMAARSMIAPLRDYWNDIPAFRPPMTSLRDVDEAGYIVAAGRDPLATGRSSNIDRGGLAAVMRAIRTQRGFGSELDADGGADG